MNTRLTSLISVVALVALAACGSSSTGVTLPQGSPTPTNTSPPPGPTPVPDSVAKADAQYSLIGFSGLTNIGQLSVLFNNLPNVGVRALRHAGEHVKPAAAGFTCQNQQSLAVSAGANNATVYVLQGYYDVPCTKKEYEFDATVNVSGTTVVGLGEQSYFDGTGKAIGVGTIDSLNITGLGTASADAITRGSVTVGGGTLKATYGDNCTVGASASCGVGVVSHDIALQSDYGVVLGATFPSPGSLTGVTATGTAEFGALNALVLGTLPSLPFWQITGATPGATVTASGSGLAFNDAANNTLVTLNVANSTINGTITSNSTGSTVGTFTVDAYGVGTVTYSDNGTPNQVVGYLVI